MSLKDLMSKRVECMERVIDGYGGEREKDDDDELTRAAERVS